jgi:hypothetical protein
MSEPPVFYPGIGDVQDAAGSFTDMAGREEINTGLRDEVAQGMTGAEGFRRKPSSGFRGANLMESLRGQ